MILICITVLIRDRHAEFLGVARNSLYRVKIPLRKKFRGSTYASGVAAQCPG